MLKLYGEFFSIHLRGQMQYKVSFFFTFIGQFLTSFCTLAGVYIMFSNFSSVGGFSLNEVLLCFSVINIAFALAETFARGFDTFGTMIGNGEFDRILLRPKNPIFLVLASTMEFYRLGKAVQGIIVVIFVLPISGVEWTGDKIFTYILMVICGTVVFACMFLIYASLCFFTTEGLEVVNIFTDGAREYAMYPISIYGANALKFLTFLVPIALFQYYPFLYLIGDKTNKLWTLSPLLSLLFVIPSYILWRIGLRHYKSTGS